MSLFQSMNVMGPANRSNQIAALAQKAAQNVLRRQKLKALLSSGPAGAVQGAGGGPGTPMNSSLGGHAMGVRGHVQNPGISQNDLAQMMKAAGHQGFLPDGRFGGMFSKGGGGYDFGALPNPHDMHQSPASLQGPHVDQQPSGPAAPPAHGGGGGVPVGANLNPVGPGSYPTGNAVDNVGALPENVHGWIPIGGGVFYDPVNDVVRGQPQLNPIDRRF